MKRNRAQPGFFMSVFCLENAPMLGAAANRRQKNGRLMRPEKSIDA
jgi:hypothetical protein